MKRKIISYTALVALSFFAVCVQAQPQIQVEKKVGHKVFIISEGPRALQDALHMLEQQIGCVITYEDPDYKSATMVKEVFPGGIFIPRAQDVIFSFNPATKDREINIIQALLDTYQHQDKTVTFQVKPSSTSKKIFNVIPAFEENKEEKIVTSNPSLNKKISLINTDTYDNLLKQISAKLSDLSNGYHVLSSLPPTQAFFTTKVAFNSSNASARKCLNALLNNYNFKEKGTLSWDFLRDPRLKFASINFYPLVPVKNSNDVNLSIESKRPLVDAIAIVAKRHQQSIIYEDPPYLCPCQVWRDKSGTPQALSGGIFDFSYSSNDKFNKILSISISAFNNHHVGKFKIQPVSNSFFVYPTEFMNAKEKTLPHKPLLETPISLSSKGKPIKENLKQLCVALTSQTPYKVSLGELPSLPLFQQVATDDMTKQPAVEYLSKLSQKTGDKLSWQLLYLPKTSEYVLNAHLIDQE